jgi:hypothetical protein
LGSNPIAGPLEDVSREIEKDGSREIEKEVRTSLSETIAINQDSERTVKGPILGPFLSYRDNKKSVEMTPFISCRETTRHDEILIRRVPTCMSYRYIYLKNVIDHLSYTKYGIIKNTDEITNSLLSNREVSEEAQLFHNILKASSFSCFAYCDNIIRTTKLPLPYKIKYEQPQSNPTIELFVSQTGTFVTIRTAIYLIKYEDTIKGDFVVKWTVYFDGETYQTSTQIVSINLNHNCTLKDHKVIYLGLKI